MIPEPLPQLQSNAASDRKVLFNNTPEANPQKIDPQIGKTPPESIPPPKLSKQELMGITKMKFWLELSLDSCWYPRNALMPLSET